MVSILIVDDEISIRESLQWLLEGEEYDVTCAMNFKEAKMIIDDQTFDVYLINVQLHDGVGTDLLKFKKDGKKGGIVIVMTGLPTINLANLNGLDVDACLRKPFSMDELKDVMSRGLEP